MKRKALGKGLENIIKNQSIDNKHGISEIDVSDIYPNPYQPRKTFDNDKIRTLAQSIEESGLIQPVLVHKKEGKFYLVVGERRWRAFQYLKKSKIPAYVKEFNKNEMIINSLVENIQREDLNAIEVAEGLDELFKISGLTQEKVAEKIGMNRTTLTNYLRLLNLPVEVKEAIGKNQLSQGHARALLSLNATFDILEGFKEVKKRNLTVRETEKLVKDLLNSTISKSKVKNLNIDPDILNMQDQLSSYFSTKVKLNYSLKGKGKIEIYFNQLEECERLIQIILQGDKQ